MGAALAAAGRGADPPRPAELRRRALRLAASPRLAHLLGVNGFFCALGAQARSQTDTALVSWWSERRCAEHYGELVRPDAHGVWAEHGRQVGFFVEYDTGTEPLARVADKICGYTDLAAGGGPGHAVCFWLGSAVREAHLRRLLADRRPQLVVATASAELAAVLDTGPAGAVWLCVDSERRRRLVDLPAPSWPASPR